jgi:rhomboid family protein
MLPVVSHEARTHRWPYVTICLVGLNVLVFAFELSMGPRFVPFLQEWGLVPARVNAGVTAHNVLTVGTSMFLHVSVVHLVTNLWFLYVFGDAVEDAFGAWWFLSLYLLSGFFGGMTFVWLNGGSPLPAVGASAAISGVMAASLILWPRARLRVPGALLIAFMVLLVDGLLAGTALSTQWRVGLLVVLGVALSGIVVELGHGVVDGMIRGIRVPAWFVLGMYLAMQLFNGVLALIDPVFGTSVGWWAHIGGFAAGAVFAWVFPKDPVVLAEG